MGDKETNSTVETQQALVGLVADLLMTAERELAAFYRAIDQRYGPEEARKAAHDWIEEVETMDWPAVGAVPNWRRVSIAAADCLSARVIESSQKLLTATRVIRAY
jgi:hypothetical protein